MHQETRLGMEGLKLAWRLLLRHTGFVMPQQALELRHQIGQELAQQAQQTEQDHAQHAQQAEQTCVDHVAILKIKAQMSLGH